MFLTFWIILTFKSCFFIISFLLLWSFSLMSSPPPNYTGLQYKTLETPFHFYRWLCNIFSASPIFSYINFFFSRIYIYIYLPLRYGPVHCLSDRGECSTPAGCSCIRPASRSWPCCCTPGHSRVSRLDSLLHGGKVILLGTVTGRYPRFGWIPDLFAGPESDSDKSWFFLLHIRFKNLWWKLLNFTYAQNILFTSNEVGCIPTDDEQTVRYNCSVMSDTDLDPHCARNSV